MSAWVLFKRQSLLGDKKTEYGVDLYGGSKFNSLEGFERAGYSTFVRTIASGESPSHLARLISAAGLSLDSNDLLTTIARSGVIIPNNKYIDLAVNPDEILDFNRSFEGIREKA